MSRIYRTSDIIKIEVDGLKIGVSPLTFDQKMIAQALVMNGDVTSAMKGAAYAVKCALKSIEGLTDADGQEYALSFNNNMLSDECWDDIQNIEQATKLTLVSLNLLAGMPKEFTDPNNGKRLEGVSIIKTEGSKAKKTQRTPGP